MNQLLPVILSSGFAVGFLHAAIPTHWLPFELVGRAQRWNRPKTLTVTVLAGGGHVIATTVLGVLLVWFGIKLDQRTGAAFPWVAGGVLIAIALFYFVRQAQLKSMKRACSGRLLLSRCNNHFAGALT